MEKGGLMIISVCIKLSYKSVYLQFYLFSRLLVIL